MSLDRMNLIDELATHIMKNCKIGVSITDTETQDDSSIHDLFAHISTLAEQIKVEVNGKQ